MTQRYAIPLSLIALSSLAFLSPIYADCQTSTVGAPTSASLSPDPAKNERDALVKQLSSSKTDAERREAMRRLAYSSANLMPAFPAFRVYLTSADEKTRDYATLALKRLVRLNQEQVLQAYINDMLSVNKNDREAALKEMALLSDEVWFYRSAGDKYSFIDQYNPSVQAMAPQTQDDYKKMDASPALPKLRRQLLTAIREQGLADSRDSVRSLAIQSVIRIGEEVNRTRMHTHLYASENVEPDVKPVADALAQARATKHSQEVAWHSFPNQTAKIDQLRNNLTRPPAVF